MIALTKVGTRCRHLPADDRHRDFCKVVPTSRYSRKYFIVHRFRQWKSFRCWRKALSRHKFQSAKQVIQERHFINYPDLRKTYCEIQDVLSGISDMGMIEVGPTRTYTLTEFCQEQEERCKNYQLCEIVFF